MSWLTDRLSKLTQERSLANDTLARQLGIERSRLSNIMAGSAIPNDNLIKRLAKYFDEDAEAWLSNVQKREDAK
ncbi:MAG: hypothetical protein JWQ55_4180, partial [Rhodopila sp.]|nr:hypothetical protein [Rhodopila sp.]